MIDLKTSEALIKQLKATVRQHGEVHVCGCGNFYTDKESALRKKNFTNPDQEEASFMLTYNKVEDIPNTVKELDDAFFNSRRRELSKDEDSTLVKNRNIVDMSEPKEEKEETAKEETTDGEPKEKGKKKKE